MQRVGEFQLQRVLRRCSRKRVGIGAELPVARLPAVGQSVILHQVHGALKLAEMRPGHDDGVEAEVSVRVLDAQVRRSELGFHGQGEEVTRVRAVSYQEGTVQSLVQNLLSFSCRYRAPVPACGAGKVRQSDAGSGIILTNPDSVHIITKLMI